MTPPVSPDMCPASHVPVRDNDGMENGAQTYPQPREGITGTLRISREAIDKLLEGQHPPRDPYDRTMTDLIMQVHRLQGELHAVQAVTVYLVGQMGGEVTVPAEALTSENPWQISVARNNANDGLVLHADDWADAMRVPAPLYLRDLREPHGRAFEPLAAGSSLPSLSQLRQMVISSARHSP